PRVLSAMASTCAAAGPAARQRSTRGRRLDVRKAELYTMVQSAPMDLRVPKRAVTVEIARAGSGPVDCELFVFARGDTAAGVLDVLADAHAFVPARVDGAVTGINRDAVCWVGLAAPPGDDLFDVRRMVEVELAGGALLTGELLFSAPEAAARVSDYLNRAGR